MFQGLIDNLLFVFQRLTWTSVLDIFLVALVFYGVLLWLQNTQAMALVRGVVVLIVVLTLLTSAINLPAFSWLMRTITPALVLAIPVIFAPEIRQALERLGRASAWFGGEVEGTHALIPVLVEALARLADRRHGALIALQRVTPLDEYMRTGVPLDALVSVELLLQIFYPKTPLHDGAVIIQGDRVRAAGCVLPLSASGVLNRSAAQRLGLRHRAALGLSEVSDAVVLVVSEETGAISLAVRGRLLRRLSLRRVEQMLNTLFRPPEEKGWEGWRRRLLQRLHPPKQATTPRDEA